MSAAKNLRPSPFEIEPGFVSEDNRKNRGIAPVTKETLENKNSTMLPEWLVKGKSVLDLGSCLGASGHWALSMGASRYVGVELHGDYVEASKKLLSKHWPHEKFEVIQSEINDYFKSSSDQKFDIVVLAGVLYVFVDYYSVLKSASEMAKDCVIIDNVNPQNVQGHPAIPVVEFVGNQRMVLPGGVDQAQGFGARLSSGALQLVMKNLGFENTEGLLFPPAVQGIHDPYHEVMPGQTRTDRYLMRFKKAGSRIHDLATEIKTGEYSKPKVSFGAYQPGQKIPVSTWKFDQNVAENFETIATTSIPRYKEVIGMCIEIASKAYPNKQCRVIDVGSATGRTVSDFIEAGFADTWGVDNSQEMIQKSTHRDRMILSETFPKQMGPFEIVCANWTLHFINARSQYLADIYEGMAKDGLLILSDKMQANSFILDLYHDFKRKNGLTEKQIIDKALAIKGVLNTYPLEWYINELKTLGFSEVHVINAHYHFNTILAQK